LTARRLAERPTDPRALRLRRQAAEALGVEAARAASTGDREAALALYGRALRLSPGHPLLLEAHASLAERDEQTAALKWTPAQPLAGRSLSLVATDLPQARLPVRFQLLRAGDAEDRGAWPEVTRAGDAYVAG